VEIRLFSDELEQLSEGVNLVAGALREIDLATDVRHDLGPGEPTLRVVIDDAAAARVGLSRADVAMALYGQTRGLPVGQLRTGEDPVPIVVRSSAGERLDADVLQVLDVAAPDGSVVPLAQVARIEAQWRPAAIHHRGRERIATVSSQLAPWCCVLGCGPGPATEARCHGPARWCPGRLRRRRRGRRRGQHRHAQNPCPSGF
jgi:multidrug efflux pump subunit AcrB